MLKRTFVPTFLLSLMFGCAEPQTQFEALSSPSDALKKKIEPYIEPSIAWVYENETNAFENGVALTNEEKRIAKEIGVRDADKVRVVYVDTFPFPKNQFLAEFADIHGFDSPQLAGMTYRYGIYIRHGHGFILPHKLVHVRQFEEMGVQRFMERYFLELTVMGYRDAPLEVKARHDSKMYQKH